jgi:hypothetical protein
VTEPEPQPAEGVPVELSWQKMWCPAHRALLACTPRSAAARAMLDLFSAALGLDEVIAAADGDLARAVAVLDGLTPLCDRIPAGELQAIYARTVPGASVN